MLIRCDGDPLIGFGHVVRCLALADELRDRYGCVVDFAVMQGSQGVVQIEAKGYRVFHPADDIEFSDEDKWLQELIAKNQHHVLIMDVRTNLKTEAVQSIRESGVVIVTIDDTSPRRLHADLAFYPPVPQVDCLDWTGFTGELFIGWDWVILRPQFTQSARRARASRSEAELQIQAKNRPLTLLVTMGGSDPAGLTLMALEGLEQIGINLRVLIVIGGGFMHETALNELLGATKKRYEICRNVTDMASLMTEVDVAVASFGVTAYELAAMGVPTIHLCLTPDHATSCQAFVTAEMAISLGEYGKVQPIDIARAVHALVMDPRLRRTMSERGLLIIKRDGLTSIASKIIKFCSTVKCAAHIQT